MNNIVKKITTVSLFTLLSFNVSATELKLPQKSILNNSNNALQLPEELRYFMQNGINAKGIISSTIDAIIDPRGYHSDAYPDGKRPKFGYELGNLGTGKCHSDPKGNGIWCP